MNKTSSNKSWVWILIIIVVVLIAYFYFYGNSTPSSLVSSTNSADASVGAQVLRLLNQTNNLKIDTSVFNDPGYKTLRDYSVSIPAVNVGRPNPFAPLPGIANTPIQSPVTSQKTTGSKTH